MKVGDYVRTKEFGISRIKWFDNEEPILENGFTALQKEYKSSPNIIDLIELRDIVELFEEDDIDGEITGYYEVLAYTTDRKEIGVRNKDGEIDWYPSENFRGIITHEQIENMEYKVKE